MNCMLLCLSTMHVTTIAPLFPHVETLSMHMTPSPLVNQNLLNYIGP